MPRGIPSGPPDQGDVVMVGTVLIKPPTWIDGLVLLVMCLVLWWTYWPAARLMKSETILSERSLNLPPHV